MGIDPISLGLTLLAVYAMLKRSPQWAGEMAEEWRAAKRGEESPAATARRKRLIDAGIDPATGGAMRQYMGNRWREHWLDADQKAKARRAARLNEADVESVKSWRDRLAERADEQIEQRVAAWRSRPESDRRLYDTTAPEGDTPNVPPSTTPDHTTAGADTDRQPPTDTHTTSPDSEEPITFPHNTNDHQTETDQPREPFRQPTDGHIPHQRRDPIRVEATVGAPIREPNQHQNAAPAAITAGGTMSNALAPTAVTGVTSGAAEARSIQRALDAANAAYVTALTQVRNRIQALGEQTVGNVQMAVHSRVVGHTAAAAEAAAAAQAAARSCGAEVGPLLGQVAREFDRISS